MCSESGKPNFRPAESGSGGLLPAPGGASASTLGRLIDRLRSLLIGHRPIVSGGRRCSQNAGRLVGRDGRCLAPIGTCCGSAAAAATAAATRTATSKTTCASTSSGASGSPHALSARATCLERSTGNRPAAPLNRRDSATPAPSSRRCCSHSRRFKTQRQRRAEIINDYLIAAVDDVVRLDDKGVT